MVYQQKNTDWNKEDVKDWDTYSNEYEAVLCTQLHFIDKHDNNKNITELYETWIGYSIYC